MTANYERPPLPKILYKYRDINNSNHLEILKKQTIFLSSVSGFNDPFDCKIPLDFQSMTNNRELQRKFVRKLAEMYHPKKDEIEMVVEKIMQKGPLNSREHWIKQEADDLERLQNSFGIFCLSQEPDNILLWSHYSNCHTGVCIGFNAKKLYDILKFSAVGPVTYFAQYPNLSVLRDNEDLFYNQVYNKSIDWYYEKEWRYIKFDAIDAKLKFPTEIVEEIYLGCMIADENETMVRKIRGRQFSKAKLFKFKKSKVSYSLEREEV
jgi:hypothetical protein